MSPPAAQVKSIPKIKTPPCPIINGDYYERIEDHFAKITKGNELGYPYIVGEYCEITPNYRLESSVFKEQAITLDVNIEDYK